jgi:hypothetical protein
VDSSDAAPEIDTTPETYLSVGKVVNYGGTGPYVEGIGEFTYPQRVPDDTFTLRGQWALDYQGATATGERTGISLNYHAKDVFIVAGGEGSLTVSRGGETKTVAISGPPTLHQIVDDDASGRGMLEVEVPKGIQVFSFTYG